MTLMLPPESLLDVTYGEIKFVGIPINIAEHDVPAMLENKWVIVQPKFELLITADTPESEDKE